MPSWAMVSLDRRELASLKRLARLLALFPNDAPPDAWEPVGEHHNRPSGARVTVGDLLVVSTLVYKATAKANDGKN